MSLEPDGETLFQLFSMPDARLSGADPARGDDHRAPDADSALWRRAGGGHSRRSDAARSTIPTIAIATASAAARRSSPTWRRACARVGRFGWKAQHATLLAFSARRVSQRDGHHQRLFPRGAGRRRDRRAMRAAIRCPIPRTSRDPRDAAGAASTTSNRSCSFWRRSARRRDRRARATASRCSPPSAARTVTCRA